jgi:hypothetical protein
VILPCLRECSSRLVAAACGQSECRAVLLTVAHSPPAVAHPGNIQGIFRQHSGNIQETFRKHSGNIRGTFSPHSGNIWPPHSGSMEGHIQGTFGQHSANIEGTFREHSVRVERTPVSLHPNCKKHIKKVPKLTQNTTCKQEYLRRGLTRPREHSGNIQGTPGPHSV